MKGVDFIGSSGTLPQASSRNDFDNVTTQKQYAQMLE